MRTIIQVRVWHAARRSAGLHQNTLRSFKTGLRPQDIVFEAQSASAGSSV